MVLQVAVVFGWTCGFPQTENPADMSAQSTTAIKGFWDFGDEQSTRKSVLVLGVGVFALGVAKWSAVGGTHVVGAISKFLVLCGMENMVYLVALWGDFESVLCTL